MKKQFLFTFWTLIGFSLFGTIYAGGGDDHTHAGDQTASANPGASYFSTESSSEKYELLLRFAPIIPGKAAHLTLFISDFITNKPIDKAVLEITAQEDPSISFTAQQNGIGTYMIEGMFPEEKTYSLAVKISGPLGADLMLLQHIEVGAKLPTDEVSVPKSNWAVPGDQWLMIILALIAGLGLGLLFRRRNTSTGKATLSAILILICCAIPFQSGIAHGDDDHGAGGSGNVFSNTLDIPKETQFLFDVYTQKVSKGNFTESTKLFGAIIPSSSGKATVSTPQNGTVRSVQTAVGRQVVVGQTLAVIEQNIDAATQINMLAERNNLLAEYEASKKEVQRLQSIKDIAAKKDVDEADARFQKADTNLRLFNSNTGRTITLKAPISGVVGNFNIAVGTTVNAGQELFTITNLATLYVEAQVFDKDAEKIVSNAKYTVECANDDLHKTSQIKLLSYAQEINTTNQSQRVLFEVENPDGDFKIGEFVNIRVFASEASKQITLPNSAITEINGRPVIFIKDAAEKYAVSYVQLGDNNGTYTAILKGLEEDERAVINGSYQLKMIYLNQ